MSGGAQQTPDLARQLAEAQATIDALLSGQIDAVIDSRTSTPVLLAEAQQSLRDSEARYRRIVETANEGIWSIDLQSRMTFVNQRFAEMIRLPVEEILGKSLFDFVPEASQLRAAARAEAWRRGIFQDDEVGFARRDGTELWALLKTSAIRDEKGRYAGTLAMVTDRTASREAEDARRKSEEQYRQIVEVTSDGVIKLDTGLDIVFANRRFAEMLGYELAEVVGRHLYHFMGTAVRKAVARQLQSFTTDSVDTSLLHKNGAEISVTATVTHLVDVMGQTIGYLGVVRDVTQQKKMQAQLMVSDRMASVGTLAAGVAHEINNPLSAVIANLAYISEGLEPAAGCDSNEASAEATMAWVREEIKAPLDDAREAAERVRFIVRDLKIFSRAPKDESGGPVDVQRILESSLRMAWNEIRHRARLVKDYAVVPGVAANEARLGQVFLNLIVNAAQAIPEGHAEHNEIRVTTRLEGERVVVEIRDTGPGIPPEIIGRIFDAFFTTKAVGVGTGLGLAICQRIVTDLGGALTVASEVGKGTTFRVELPIGVEVECEEMAGPDSPPRPSRRGRILVVDDEELVGRGIERCLFKDHDVITVVAAREALERCAGGERFDLILCDLMMPEMTGMDLHRELSLVAPEQAGRMIFMTAGAFTENARLFLSSPSIRHLEKPFDADALRSIIEGNLEEPASSAAASSAPPAAPPS